MKIPHKIRITAKVSYEVCFVDRFDDAKQMGECRFESKQILVLNGLSDRELQLTLIHEIFHAICFEGPIDVPHKAIYGLEKAILRLIKLNKWGLS